MSTLKQAAYAVLTLTVLTGKMIWAKVRNKPYDSGMDA